MVSVCDLTMEHAHVRDEIEWVMVGAMIVHLLECWLTRLMNICSPAPDIDRWMRRV